MSALKHISVIIPAHNEEAVIGRCLQQLSEASDTLELEIIVVCNGCNDRTAKVVRAFSQNIICIETSVASKTHALNLGDAKASYFPRFYLDADILFSIESLCRVVEEMDKANAFAAAPQVKMDLSGCSWAVKSYYDIWCNLPYCKEGMIGAGVYALSEQGRNQFETFPDIIADDRYIRALFTESQRLGVKGARSIVSAPTTLNGLIKIKTRSRLGGYEFESRFPELLGNEVKSYGTAIQEVMWKVSMWPKAITYFLINILTRVRARRQSRSQGFSHWERDDSSREKLR